MIKDVKVVYFLKTKIEYQFFLTAEEQYLERRKRSSAKKKKKKKIYRVERKGYLRNLTLLGAKLLYANEIPSPTLVYLQ